MTEFDSDELPAFREWRSQFQPSPDTYSYIAEHLSVTDAFLMAKLLAPDFIVMRGCVLREDRFDPDNFEHWWASQAGNTTAIEHVINHLHLWDIFDPEGDVEECALEALAERVALSWKLHASHQFPERDFHVEVTGEYGPTVAITSDPKTVYVS